MLFPAPVYDAFRDSGPLLWTAVQRYSDEMAPEKPAKD